MRNLTKTVIAAFFVTLIAGAAAASPADVNIFPSQSSTRIDSFTEFEVTVVNSGPVKDTYELSSSSPTEITIAPREVTLQPGNKETVNLWYNPVIDKEEGTYSFTVTATSQASGKRYSETAQVSVIKEHKVNVKVGDASRTGCLGEKVQYSLTVTNNGIQQERFDLETDAGKLSTSKLNLEDGETVNVTLTLSSKKPVQKTFNVIASSQSSYAQDIERIDFRAERCWASDVSITPQQKDVAAETAATFKVTVRNTGTRSDSFTLSTTRGELADTSLEIEGKSSGSTTLTVRPEKLGKKTVKVTAKSHVTSSATASYTVYNGMNVEVTADRQSFKMCEDVSTGVEFTVENTGAAQETYSLNASTGELQTSKLELEEGESETVEVEFNASERTLGKHSVTLKATAESFGRPEKTATSTVRVQNCWDLSMNVVPSIVSAGDNRSVIYKVRLTNNGTRENTYQLSHDGPSWVSLKPEEVTVAPSKTKTAFIYAGIPYKEKGEIQIKAIAEGREVERSETARLVMGEKVKDAIKDDSSRKGLLDSLTGSVTKSFKAAAGSSRLLLSILVGVGITALVLLREW
ncbi:MAG: hypothetical protein ABEJ98_00040 [Candidatus Nanohaloarchaea archaeon]